MVENLPIEVLESGEKVPAKVEPLPVDETTPCFRNIHVKNLVCAGARRALFFNGIPEMPIENVVLEDVDITSDWELNLFIARPLR